MLMWHIPANVLGVLEHKEATSPLLTCCPYIFVVPFTPKLYHGISFRERYLLIFSDTKPSSVFIIMSQSENIPCVHALYFLHNSCLLISHNALKYSLVGLVCYKDCDILVQPPPPPSYLIPDA